MKLSAYIPKEKGGFLNELGNKYIPEQYKRLYEYASDINELLYDLYQDKNMNICNEEKKYFFMLFGEMHKTYQSIIILSQRGLEEDALTLTRRLYEMLFKLVAIFNDKENIKQIKEDRLAEYNILQDKIEKNYPGMEILKNKGLNFRDGIEHKKISVYSWAKRAGMEDIYNCEYSILCSYSHASYDTINAGAYNEIDSIMLLYIPCYNNYEMIVSEAICIMVKITEVLIKKLNLALIDEKHLNNIKEELEKIKKETKGEKNIRKEN